MDDTQLLYDYVEAGDAGAFGELVRRHIDMVYAAARRQTGDSHLAEDVTQAVFIVLARKAAKVRNGGVLPAWLLSSTRYAASNALALEQRRRRNETKAAAMKSREYASPELELEQDDPIVATLDQAMARLGEADRSAVAMRYLQDKTFVEVAAAMKTTEEAARKRVERAVHKLRDYFARRGVTLDGTQLDTRLLRQVKQVAPAALAPMVTAKALSAKSIGALGAAGAGGMIAGGVIRALTWTTSAKVVLASCAAVVVIAGTGAVVVQSKRATASAMAVTPVSTIAPVVMAAASAPATVPAVRIFNAQSMWMPYVPSETPGTEVLALANNSLTNKRVIDGYTIGFDEAVKRKAEAAIVIRGLTAASEPQSPHQSVRRIFDAAPYRGKRIRLSGYVKSKDVERSSGIGLWVYGKGDDLISMDDLSGRWVYGTTGWARQDIVSDVPAEATAISVTVYLMGQGTVWADGLELAVVGNDVPLTDDQRWRCWTTAPPKFHVMLDRKELHNGRPTIRISSADVPHSEWIGYQHATPDMRPYWGKKLRLTATIKSEGLDGSAGPILRAVGPNNSSLKGDSLAGRRPVSGSMDWGTYTSTLVVPKDAAGLTFGVNMNGQGTIWIDELRFEIVGEGKSE